jgi:hypothetical protein
MPKIIQSTNNQSAVGTSEINYLRIELSDSIQVVLFWRSCYYFSSPISFAITTQGEWNWCNSDFIANGRLPQQDGVELSNEDLLLVWQQASPFQTECISNPGYSFNSIRINRSTILIKHLSLIHKSLSYRWNTKAEETIHSENQSTFSWNL